MIRVLIVGEAWGEQETVQRRPFVGPAGRYLAGTISRTGLERNLFERLESGLTVAWDRAVNTAVTSVLNFQPRPTNNILNCCGLKAEALPGYPPVAGGKYLRAEYAPEIERLYQEIHSINPNLILALGNTAMVMLTKSQISISKQRGTLMESVVKRRDGTPYKVLATIHPANCLYDHSNRPIFANDVSKAVRFSSTPIFERPSRTIWIEPNSEDLLRFHREHMADPYRPCGVDIETYAGTITEIGFGYPETAIVIPFYSRRVPDGNYWPSLEHELYAWNIVTEWLNYLKRPVFQNGMYDLAYLWRTMRLAVPHAAEDTMLLHHVLQPEMEKSLGFLGSTYTDEPSWKLMRKHGPKKMQKREDF